MERALPWRRNLGLLLAGRITSNAASAAFDFGVGLYALSLAGEASALSAILIASVLPRALLSGAAGAAVDRLPRRALLVGCDAAAGAVAVAGALLLPSLGREVGLLVAVTAALSAAGAVLNLALFAATPDLVGKEHVFRANALQRGAGAAVAVAGPVIGALALDRLGIEGLFAANAASYLVAAGLALGLRLPPPAARPPRRGLRADAAEVWAYLQENPRLKALLALALALQALFEPLTRLVLPYVTYTVLGLSEAQVSSILSAAAAGVGLTAAALGRLGSTRGLLRWFGPLLIAQGALFVAWTFPLLGGERGGALALGIFLALQVAGRALNTAQNLPLFSYFQEEIPGALRGRMLGLLNTALLLVVPASLWIAGQALERVHWAVLPAACGALVMAGGAVASKIRLDREV